MPKFNVRETFELPDRRLFVMAGVGAAGQVLPGMYVRVPCGAGIPLSARIHSLEYMRREGGEEVWLCFAPQVAEWLRSAGKTLANETLEVAADSGQTSGVLDSSNPFDLHALFNQEFRCSACRRVLASNLTPVQASAEYLRDIAGKAKATGWYVPPPTGPDATMDLWTCYCPTCALQKGLAAAKAAAA